MVGGEESKDSLGDLGSGAGVCFKNKATNRVANWNEKGKGAGVFCLKNIIEKKKVGTGLLTPGQWIWMVQPIHGKAPNLGLVYVVTIHVYYA